MKVLEFTEEIVELNSRYRYTVLQVRNEAYDFHLIDTFSNTSIMASGSSTKMWFWSLILNYEHVEYQDLLYEYVIYG
jgi:hypothetical protein